MLYLWSYPESSNASLLTNAEKIATITTTHTPQQSKESRSVHMQYWLKKLFFPSLLHTEHCVRVCFWRNTSKSKGVPPPPPTQTVQVRLHQLSSVILVQQKVVLYIYIIILYIMYINNDSPKKTAHKKKKMVTMARYQSADQWLGATLMAPAESNELPPGQTLDSASVLGGTYCHVMHFWDSFANSQIHLL